MKELNKLEILHLNDFHSDFFPQEIDGKEVGGVSRISNYVNKQRNKENCLFLFAGDASNGNINDSEYFGVSTCYVLNRLHPDAMCPGNHEIDYGLSQLALINQLAIFPIVCCNINSYFGKFLNPYTVIEKNGLKILVIGVITRSIEKNLLNDKTSFKSFYVTDYIKEIKEIYETEDYKNADMVIILSHIGYEEDLELAKLLPNDKFTMIIGGHSHTLLNEPVYINNIPIVQVGIGSSRLGKFTLTYDQETNKVEDTSYEIIEINEDNCQHDIVVDKYLEYVQGHTSKKYESVLCTLDRALENKDRNSESEMCNFIADIFNDMCETDLFIFDPGSTKAESMGPVIRYKDLRECFARINALAKCYLTGAQLKQLFSYSLVHYGSPNNDDLFVQHVSKNVGIIYDENNMKLVKLLFKGKEVLDDDLLSVSLYDYSLKNSLKKFSIDYKGIIKNRHTISLHPNCLEAFYNYMIDYGDEIKIYSNKRYIPLSKYK